MLPGCRPPPSGPDDVLGRRGHRDRGHGRRHDQHRGGLRLADHVPDAARARVPAGARQRVEQHRPRPGRDLGRVRVPAGAGRAAGPDPPPRAGIRARRAHRRAAAPRPAEHGVQAGRRRAHRRSRSCSWCSDRACRSASPGRTKVTHGCRSTLVVLVGLAGIYGGYFGAAQGIILIAVLGIFVLDDLQRLNATKNVLAMTVNVVAAVVFVLATRIDWAVVACIAAGSIVGGQIGATVGPQARPTRAAGPDRGGGPHRAHPAPLTSLRAPLRRTRRS